eukprot:Seg469.6 transcript_id=Seg469.6/GoldUCD/mRNA.D3Y31 product="Transient receptor potential cation channel subfamily M member 6" protein_id=Seg469.6/GoldUCD/D3Y31
MQFDKTISSSHGNAMVSSITYGKNDISLPAVPPTAFPQSISVAALLQARKLVNPPNVTRVKLELESYIVAEKKWAKAMKVELLKENTSFAEGGFRNAFLATDETSSGKWVIKDVPVTVEEYIAGDFEKYINNTGVVAKALSPAHEVILEKASCFAHFSYVHTEMQMMVLDLQGVAYSLCDPEIATITLLEDGELNFCAGNLSSDAINQFLGEHNCNRYCKMLALPEKDDLE